MVENKESQQEDFQIGDIEGFSSKDQQFSHEFLVMMALKKSFEYGAREMRPGYFNEKVDLAGNVSKTYVDDTRKGFIETVKTTLAFIKCDLDTGSKEKIKSLRLELEETHKKLIEKEKQFWDVMTPKEKGMRWNFGQSYVKDSLNTGLPFYQTLIEEQVEIYREILGELSELTKRIDFYQSQDLGA